MQEQQNQPIENEQPQETQPEPAAPAPTPTAGVKNKINTNAAMLNKAAEKAASTGKRADLMQYLRARRAR